MKKLIVAIVVFGAASGTLFAFDLMSYPPPVKKGNLLVDLGIGFGFNPGRGSVSIPPISANVEYALPVNVPVSVGGEMGFFQYKRKWGGFDETFTYFVFGAKGNWHWGFNVDWLDLYSGLFFGYRYADWNGPSGWSDPGYSGLEFGAQIGAHFYFTKTVGAVVELGAPFSKIGLALKF
jgi:hypothetical protein